MRQQNMMSSIALILIVIGSSSLMAAEDANRDCVNLEAKIENEIKKGDLPLATRLYKQLGDCFFQQGKNKEGLAAYQKATSYPYEYLTEAERYAIAQRFLEEGKQDLAVVELQKIITHNPQNKEAQNLLAVIRSSPKETKPEAVVTGEKEEKDESCKAEIQKIVEAERNGKKDQLGALYKQLGACYANNGRIVKAEDAYEMALFYDRLSIDERVELAKFLGNQGRDEAAIFELQKVVVEAPKHKEALIALAQFLNWRGKEGDQNEAEIHINAALAIDPNDKAALIVLGNIYNYTERSQEALPLFKKIAERNDLTPEEIFSAQAGIALAYINLLDFECAECAIAQLDPELLFQEKIRKSLKEKLVAKLEEVKNKQEEPRKKAEELKEAVQAFVDRAYLLNECYWYQAAYWELAQALRKDPCSLNARIALATTLGLDGRYYGAMRQINWALARDPCNVDAWITSGMILRWKGDILLSDYAYRKAMQLEPENFNVLLGLAYTDLARDERVRAFQLGSALQPKNPIQCKATSDLFYELVLGPIVTFDWFKFRDSDHIKTDDYLLNVAGYWCDYRFDFFYHHVNAKQPVDRFRNINLRQRVDHVKAEFLKHYGPLFDFGGGIGYANTSQGNFLTGNARGFLRTNCGNFAAGSAYDLFTLTAAAIFFKIRTWRNYIVYTKAITGRLSIEGDYAYTYWSDGNHSHRVDFWARYKFYRGCCWHLFLDYVTTYWDFKEQVNTPFLLPGVFGGHGYFNPKNYYENQIGLRLIQTKIREVDFMLNPFVAYVTWVQDGLHNGVYYGGRARFYYNFTNKIQAGINLEGARYPLKNLNYKYWILGAHARYAF